jgi:hypothetical protein
MIKKYWRQVTLLLILSSLLASSASAFRSSVGFWRKLQLVDYLSTLFSAGTSSGVAWDSTNNYFRLDHTGTPTNLAEFDSTWTPAWANLISVWHLDDPAGNSAADSVGSNTGTASNVTFGSTGKLKTAAYFNGTSSVINIPDSPSLRPSTLTISAWFNFSSFPMYTSIVSKAQTGPSWTYPYLSFLLRLDTPTSLNTSLGSSTTYSDTTFTIPPMTAGVWYHVAMTYDGSTIRGYLNGQLLGSQAFAGPINYVADPVEIGADYGGNPGEVPTGEIDEVAMWNTALTGPQIRTIYDRQSATYAGTFTSRVFDGLAAAQKWLTFGWTSTLPFFKELPDTGASETSTIYSSQSSSLMSGLQGLWHLDEPSTATIAIDASGTGNNGTLTGAGTFGVPGKLGTGLQTQGGYINVGSPASLQISGSVTVSAWMQSGNTFSGWPQIIGYDSLGGTGAAGHSYMLQGNNGSNTVSFSIADGTNSAQPGAISLADGAWHNVVGVYDQSHAVAKIYFDGNLVNSVAYAGTSIQSSGGFRLGYGNGVPFYGQIDEGAVWNRALGDGTNSTPNEILELYRRGANRVKYQVRSCPDSSCTTNPTWQGPDNTNQTYFSELNNNAIQNDVGDLTTSDSVKTVAPLMTFSNFPSLSLSTNRYFQYRAILESDDSSSNCNYGAGYTTTWCSPEIQSVSAGP